MLAYLRFETTRSFRDVTFLLLLIGLPTLLYVVYARDDAVLEGAPFRAFFLVSKATFTVMGSARSAAGPQLATERTGGWIRQLRVTPLSDRAWLIGKVLHGLLLTIPGLVVLTLVGTLHGQVRLALGQWVALAATLLLSAVPFVLVGIAIGLAFSMRGGQLVHTVAVFGLLFGSGILVPWPQLPEMARVVGALLPLYHMAALGWEIVGDRPVDWMHSTVLLAWTVPLGAGVLWLRRREFVGDG